MADSTIKNRHLCILYIKIIFWDAYPSKRMHPKSENFHMGCINQATLTTQASTIASPVISQDTDANDILYLAVMNGANMYNVLSKVSSDMRDSVSQIGRNRSFRFSSRYS